MAKQKKSEIEAAVEAGAVEEGKEKKVISPMEQLNSYLENNKKFFYNDAPEPTYVVSSGSLKLDIEMGGGMRPGILRLSGISEGGKSSVALSFGYNFLKTVENSFIVYFRAEGRLPDTTLIRHGLFNNPRMMIVKGNVYEKVISCMSDLIKNNPTEARYMFIFDSMDAMIPMGDLEKKPEEAMKVAGGCVLSSDMLKRMANTFVAYGHICLMISQVRSAVQIDKYAKTDPKMTNASGGNALLHYSDWILEFQQRYFGDLITSLPDQKGDIIGHNCKIVFRKSPNEKSFSKIEYPICYGRQNNQSVWVEREIFDIMVSFGMITKSGSWMKVTEPILDELKEAKLECPATLQGGEAFIKYFGENPALTKYLYEKLCKTLKK
jgi:RecA/RadA recombinase